MDSDKEVAFAAVLLIFALEKRRKKNGRKNRLFG